MPPIIKAYEALGAIGDGRVRIEDERRATVTSSDGSKTYEVEMSADGREIASNDNASYWQGYVGYPAIAVLIARGFIARRRTSPTRWRASRGRNSIASTRTTGRRLSRNVDKELEQGGHDPDAVRSEAEAVLNFLRTLKPVRGKRSRPPSEKPAVKIR